MINEFWSKTWVMHKSYVMTMTQKWRKKLKLTAVNLKHYVMLIEIAKDTVKTQKR